MKRTPISKAQIKEMRETSKRRHDRQYWLLHGLLMDLARLANKYVEQVEKRIDNYYEVARAIRNGDLEADVSELEKRIREIEYLDKGVARVKLIKGMGKVLVPCDEVLRDLRGDTLVEVKERRKLRKKR